MINTISTPVAIAIVSVLVGGCAGYSLRKDKWGTQAQNTAHDTKHILAGVESKAKAVEADLTSQQEAMKKAMADVKKEEILKAQEEIHHHHKRVDNELSEWRQGASRRESRLPQREDAIDHKDSLLNQEDSQLTQKESQIRKLQTQVSEKEKGAGRLVAKREQKLHEVAELSQEDAEEIVLDELSDQLVKERAEMIEESNQFAKAKADHSVRKVTVSAAQSSTADAVSKRTISVVNLPNDDIKGHITDREDGNIRSFETLTGADVIISDTPDIMVLSGFDPIRREVAKRILERLIKNGRIHPARVEEMIDQARKEMSDDIYEAGENVLMELGVHKMYPELVKILGCLKYRTPYRQNVLSHSTEVGRLTGVMTAELGSDEGIVVRVGLLHDTEKPIDHGTGGSHVEVGVGLARKYHEPDLVASATAAHHDDISKLSFIAELVVATGTISSARLGARSESLENYIHRLEQLEATARGYIGVRQAYTTQTDREIKAMVEPDKVSGARTIILAYDIKNQIEQNMEYPDNIKVTVIRERCTVTIAK